MAEYDNLQKALIQVMDEEVLFFEKMAKTEPHHFSREFEANMRRLIGGQRGEKAAAQTDGDKEFRPVRVKVFGRMMRRSVAVLLAAVMIMAGTIAVMAIVKPEIFFIIKEKLTHWDITPKQENKESAQKAIVPVIIDPPAGYKLAFEDLDIVRYKCRFEDEIGAEIEYSQYLPEGISMAVDSEGVSSRRIQLNVLCI